MPQIKKLIVTITDENGNVLDVIHVYATQDVDAPSMAGLAQDIANTIDSNFDTVGL